MSEVANVWKEEGGGEISVTVKLGKGYDDTWITFRDRSITGLREKVIAYFGMDSASVSALTLSDVVVNATNIAHGVGAVATGLHGTVIKSGPTEEKADPWAGLGSDAPAAAAPVENPVLAQIAATTNVAELKRVWAENQPLDAEATAAYKARGKALQQAAA